MFMYTKNARHYGKRLKNKRKFTRKAVFMRCCLIKTDTRKTVRQTNGQFKKTSSKTNLHGLTGLKGGYNRVK